MSFFKVIENLAKKEEEAFHQRLDRLRSVVRDSTQKIAQAEGGVQQARLTAHAQVVSSALKLVGDRGSDSELREAISRVFSGPMLLLTGQAQAPMLANMPISPRNRGETRMIVAPRRRQGSVAPGPRT